MSDTQQAKCSSPVTATTVEACVSGVPHTRLVLDTMQRLRRTLSSEPQNSALPKEAAQLSKPTPATTITTAASALCAATAATAQAKGAQHTEPSSAQHTEQNSAHQSKAARASPVLQPFLVAQRFGDRAGQDSGHDQVRPQLGPKPTTEGASVQHDSVPPSNKSSRETGEAGAKGQAEGEAERQIEGQAKRQTDRTAEGQPQYQEARPEEEASGRVQTGSALQQLISRAQKLKEQLDAHTAVRHDK